MRLGSGAGVLGSRKGLCGSTVDKGLERLPPNGASDGAESAGGIGVALGNTMGVRKRDRTRFGRSPALSIEQTGGARGQRRVG